MNNLCMGQNKNSIAKAFRTKIQHILLLNLQTDPKVAHVWHRPKETNQRFWKLDIGITADRGWDRACGLKYTHTHTHRGDRERGREREREIYISQMSLKWFSFTVWYSKCPEYFPKWFHIQRARKRWPIFTEKYNQHILTPRWCRYWNYQRLWRSYYNYAPWGKYTCYK